MRALSRGAGDGHPAAPVALVHLGLGNFFRAHQAWYTEHAPDAAEWGIAAFAGRSAGPAEALAPQDGLYTLITRAVDPRLAAWIDSSVSTVTTTVDRITPRTTPDDARAVRDATGRTDRAPVATEPFHEWVLSGAFTAGRPEWEASGAIFTDDITPFEHRKLWLLNGGHSLLAYAGSVRGHRTVAEAVADETCRSWLRQWWAEASPYVDLPDGDLAAYRAALLDRFDNPRIRHQLAQIAADGSQKLPVRILPTLRRERAAGHVPPGAVRVLAGWLCCLRGHGAPVDDPRAGDLVPLANGPLPGAARAVMGVLDPEVAADDDVVAAVVASAEELVTS